MVVVVINGNSNPRAPVLALATLGLHGRAFPYKEMISSHVAVSPGRFSLPQGESGEPHERQGGRGEGNGLPRHDLSQASRLCRFSGVRQIRYNLHPLTDTADVEPHAASPGASLTGNRVCYSTLWGIVKARKQDYKCVSAKK